MKADVEPNDMVTHSQNTQNANKIPWYLEISAATLSAMLQKKHFMFICYFYAQG